MIKHGEVKTYEFNGEEIMVSLNYDKKTISLVKREEKGFPYPPQNMLIAEEFIFSKKPLENIDETLNLIEAMKFAINSSKSEMNQYFEEKEKPAKEEANKIMGAILGIVSDDLKSIQEKINPTTKIKKSKNKGKGRPKKNK